MVGEKMPELPEKETASFIVDGGALLHLLPWQIGATFAAILKTYNDYVLRTFIRPTIVFDGYNGPSTKDMAHLKRGCQNVSPTVEFLPETILLSKKNEFLQNPSNKKRFVDCLCSTLGGSCTVIQAEGDADVAIVDKALESSKTNTTVVVSDDTDILVILCSKADEKANPIFLHPSHRIKTKTGSRARKWQIQHTQRQLGNASCILPVIHDISGCDTTSRPYGLGKKSVLRKFMKSKELQTLASDFLSADDKDQNVITKIGEAILCCLYGGNSQTSLDLMRVNMFSSKVATASSFIQVHSLPPTCAAAKHHSLRVYLQVQQWAGNNKLEAREWGWKMRDNLILPKTTELPPAPPALLAMIRCGCKTGCETKACSCRKKGLHCSSACKECRGQTCSNAEPFDTV